MVETHENYIKLASAVLEQARKDYHKPYGPLWGDRPGVPVPKEVKEERRRKTRQFFVSRQYEFFKDLLKIEMDGEEYFDKYVLNYKKARRK